MKRTNTTAKAALYGMVMMLVAQGVCLAEAEHIPAVTKPSGDVTLSFALPGQVEKVLVVEGDEVKAGQVVVELDDNAERAQLEQLEAQAEDTTRIRAAEARLAVKKVELERKRGALNKGGATELEVRNAELEVTIAELSLVLSKFEHEQDARKAKEMRYRLERMQLKTPIDGTVEKRYIKVGESVDKLAKVIRIVKVDPLWIDVAVPVDYVRKLKEGDRASVEFAGGEYVGGKVKHIAMVADARSRTRTVRVEVPNPARRPAGEHVRVTFPSVGAKSPEEMKDEPVTDATKTDKQAKKEQ